MRPLLALLLNPVFVLNALPIEEHGRIPLSSFNPFRFLLGIEKINEKKISDTSRNPLISLLADSLRYLTRTTDVTIGFIDQTIKEFKDIDTRSSLVKNPEDIDNTDNDTVMETSAEVSIPFRKSPLFANSLLPQHNIADPSTKFKVYDKTVQSKHNDRFTLTPSFFHPAMRPLQFLKQLLGKLKENSVEDNWSRRLDEKENQEMNKLLRRISEHPTIGVDENRVIEASGSENILLLEFNTPTHPQAGLDSEELYDTFIQNNKNALLQSQIVPLATVQSEILTSITPKTSLAVNDDNDV